MTQATYIVGDTRDVTASLPDRSVDLIFTSPPFLALRSYLPADHPAKAREIGSEATPAEFLGVLLELVRGWDRVLTPTGSLVVELGDTYSSPGGVTDNRETSLGGNDFADRRRGGGPGWPLAKSLCGIPTLFTWSLAYGRNLLAPDDVIDPWRIRNLVVWHRPNPPVGALGDKYRPSTSYITVATKSAKRWFDLDAVRTEPTAPPQRFLSHGYDRGGNGATNDRPPMLEPGNRAHPAGAPPLDAWFDAHDGDDGADGDDVWTITTDPYRGSHYATFPRALAARVIDSMCPRHVCRTCGEPRRREVEATRIVDGNYGAPHTLGKSERNADSFASNGSTERTTTGWSDCGHDDYRPGVVYDPFAGSGTTLAKAIDLGRDAIGADLDERNADLARERCGMFLDVRHHEGDAA